MLYKEIALVSQHIASKFISSHEAATWQKKEIGPITRVNFLELLNKKVLLK